MVVSAPICSMLGINAGACGILYEIIFPWIVTFAIIFGLSLKLNIFGDSKDKTARGVSGLVALSIGFFLVAFTPLGRTVGGFFIWFSGNIVIFLFVLLGILLAVGLTNPKMMPEKFDNKWAGVAAGLVIILFAWIILGGNPSRFGISMGGLFALALILAVIGGMWYIVDKGGNGGKT